MAAEQVPDVGRGSFKKPSNNTHRIWTSRKEKVLINALKDLVNKGWKSDNGFRAGYLSKFHTTTGVGFNTTTSQLECTDDEWDSVVKRDPLMRGMRYKEWPYFPDWIDIFGLDRATGSVAEDVVEMAKRLKSLYGQSPTDDIQQEYDGANYKSGGSQQKNCEGLDGSQMNDVTKSNNIARDTTHGARKKWKLKADSNGPSNMERLLGEFCHTTGERLATIAGHI
ncbi:hypothetical protein ACS0TY_002397 [Phlomoides rotata]